VWIRHIFSKLEFSKRGVEWCCGLGGVFLGWLELGLLDYWIGNGVGDGDDDCLWSKGGREPGVLYSSASQRSCLLASNCFPFSACSMLA
jgi:hypothetical protein